MQVSEHFVTQSFLKTVESFASAEGDDRIAQSRMLLNMIRAYPFLSETISPETLRAIEDADRGEDSAEVIETFKAGLKQFSLAEGDSRVFWARLILLTLRCYPYLSREVDAEALKEADELALKHPETTFDDFRKNWKDK